MTAALVIVFTMMLAGLIAFGALITLVAHYLGRAFVALLNYYAQLAKLAFDWRKTDGKSKQQKDGNEAQERL